MREARRAAGPGVPTGESLAGSPQYPQCFSLTNVNNAAGIHTLVIYFTSRYSVTAIRCDFNRSMQHLNFNCRERNVELAGMPVTSLNVYMAPFMPSQWFIWKLNDGESS